MRRLFLKAVKLCALMAALSMSSGQAVHADDADVSKANARTSPQWLRDGVIYEIFPRDFSSAGNLNGVTERLNQLKSLGVTILWVMPIHPIGEKSRKGDLGSPYSIKDYYAVDPNYGTLDDFKRLVVQAHKRNMKVIMDLVADHTSWDSVMMSHPEFYKQDENGKIVPPNPGWTDVAGLNYANPQLCDYMIAMMKYWVKTCDVDGFRCDVAYMVPTDFWMRARAELEKVKPSIMLLAEASKPELLATAFDIDYNWPLMATMNQVIEGGYPASNIRQTWEASRAQFPKGALHMEITDDHDEARAVARYGVHGALAASALMFTLDGVPLLYNGMEAGDATESGDPALFDKLTIFWTPKDRPPLRDIYHSLIELREQYPCFCDSDVTWLDNSNQNDVVTFMRGDAKDQFVVVINFSNRPMTTGLKVKDSAEFKTMSLSGMPDTNTDGLLELHLNGFEWRIYHRNVTNANVAQK
jgi:cyclomaltodextrinase / maltogenic alpha-amylase / neopullulanase